MDPLDKEASDKMYKWIRDSVDFLARSPQTTRLDAQFANVTVLVYKAGTVIRVDFKGLL